MAVPEDDLPRPQPADDKAPLPRGLQVSSHMLPVYVFGPRKIWRDKRLLDGFKEDLSLQSI